MKHVAEIQPSGDSNREPEFPFIEQKGGLTKGRERLYSMCVLHRYLIYGVLQCFDLCRASALREGKIQRFLCIYLGKVMLACLLMTELIVEWRG